MKKLIFTSVFVCVLFGAKAQSGYLGSLNNISFTIKAIPSIKSKWSLNGDLDETKRGPRLAYVNYELGYSRIVSKKIEVGVGYGYSSMKAVSDGLNYFTIDTIQLTNGTTEFINRSFHFLDEPRIDMHQFTFDFRFFRLGSLAPTGKYLGFGLEFGSSKIKSTDDITLGVRGDNTKSSYLTSKYDVSEIRNFNLANDSKSSYFQINANIGRNYPITQNLMLGVGMTFPIFTIYNAVNGMTFGFDVDGSGNSFTDDSNLRNMLQYTQEKYKRISLDLTIKYFL